MREARILLWYWGRRGGEAHFSLCLGRAHARRSAGVALSVSRQGNLIESFRALPVPRHEIDTYVDLLGSATGFLRVRTLTRNLVTFAQEQKIDVVVSAMAHLWTPLVAPASSEGAPLADWNTPARALQEALYRLLGVTTPATMHP